MNDLLMDQLREAMRIVNILTKKYHCYLRDNDPRAIEVSLKLKDQRRFIRIINEKIKGMSNEIGNRPEVR